MSTALGFVPDGHTEAGVLNEVPGLHPRLEFSYRRLTQLEFADHVHACRNLSEPEVAQVIAGHVAARVRSWDLRDADGKAVEVSEAVAARMVRRLFSRVWGVLAGLEPPDAQPGRAEEDRKADLADAMEAARTGQSVAAVREARLKKA